MILFNVVFVVVVVGLFADVCFQGGEGEGGRSTKFGMFSDEGEDMCFFGRPL